MTTATAHAAKPHPIFYPKLLTTLRSYSWPSFWGDVSAGLIVGVVALPLAIAFAIASGVTPDRGLTTAIVAGFFISALGGSRVQIGGPTGAFVVIVYGIVRHHGIDGLILCTLMAGVMLILMGACQLGAVIRFMPYPLTVGFTSGIAVIIFSQQVGEFLGLKTGAMPADFLGKWEVYLRTMGTINPAAAALALGSLALLIVWPKISRKVPGPFVVLIAATVAAKFFRLPVETIGSRFGEIPSGLPTPTWPHFTLFQLRALVSPAFTVAMLGAIESLLSATVADGMIEARHRSNTELIGQGIANIASALFGGIPATGAIARTATNVKNGGRTPVAGIAHSLTLLLIVFLFSGWAVYIPLCVLSAILVVVCYHMSEWRAFLGLARTAPRTDIAVLGTTFLLTVFVDLTAAVEVGMLMSLVLFTKRMTDATSIREVTQGLAQDNDEEGLRKQSDAASLRDIPAGVSVYEAEGALFFGVAASLRDTLTLGSKPPKVVILRMRHVIALDASGIRALADLRKTCARMGTILLLAHIHAQPRAALEKADLLSEFGKENVLAHLDDALKRARHILAAQA